jgi:FkbM family methyltransferase
MSHRELATPITSQQAIADRMTLIRRDALLRSALFSRVGRICAQMPSFRGKTRLFLILYDLLRLRRHHIEVDTLLRRPVTFRARLDLHSWLQRLAFLTGEYESDTVSFLLRLHHSMGAQGYLLDVGANVGLVSIPFALTLRHNQSGGFFKAPVVVSVEAVQANAAALKTNIELNSADTMVEVICLALGDTEKTVDIQIEGDLHDGEGTGTANILADDSGYECVRVPLQLATLDALLASKRLHPDCRVMKIDADGYDLKVLQGATRFLTISRPVIFGEFSAHCLRWHHQSLSDVARFATNLGYVVWRRNPVGWGFTTELDESSFSQDLLLVPNENAHSLSWCLAPQRPYQAAITSGIAAPRFEGMF